MMRLVLVIAFFLLSVSGCGQAPQTGAGLPEDDIRLFGGAYANAGESPDPHLFDFGRISDDDPVTHEFVITNDGDEDISITGRTNSCGCMSSEIAAQKIAPGEEIPVRVTFDPAGYSGQTTQFVYVNTDDPRNPIYKLTVKADVIAKSGSKKNRTGKKH